MNMPAARRVFDRGADRLMVEAELGRDGPELPALAVEQAPDLGALRGRDHRSSLCGSGPLGAREGAGDIAAGRLERSARPLPVAGAGLDQAAQRLVCGAAPRAILDGHLIARQADRAVDVADGTGPASSTTPHPAAEQAGPQVLRAPVAAALPSPPPDPLPGLAAALRGLTHETASSSMIRYQTDDEGVVSQPEYTLSKPSNGPNDRDHLSTTEVELQTCSSDTPLVGWRGYRG